MFDKSICIYGWWAENLENNFGQKNYKQKNPGKIREKIREDIFDQNCFEDTFRG